VAFLEHGIRIPPPPFHFTMKQSVAMKFEVDMGELVAS
jgi:hypothetical protein